MNRFKKILAYALAVITASSAAAVPIDAGALKSTEPKGSYADGEVIAVLKNSAASKYTSAKNASSLYGSSISVKSSYTVDADASDSRKVRLVVLKSSKLTTGELLSRVRANSAVKRVFPNYRKKALAFSDDTYSSFQWALENTGQNGGTPGCDIKSSALSERSAESDQVVAIIDTGIDETHEDLKDMLWNNPYGNKLIGKHGLDFTGTYSNMKPKDEVGHGTHVAGIIAAQANNKKGVSGVTNNVKIMALKFLDKTGVGYADAAFAAFEYVGRAVELGTNVTAVNCSWGGYGSDEEKETFEEIIDELGGKGVITCVAAGNVNSDHDKNADGEYDLPADCESRYCVTVAASDENDKLAKFSDYGKNTVDLAAPGTNILSCVSKDVFNPTIYSDEQRNKLCAEYQNYDGDFKEGDFGYPVIVPKEVHGYNADKVTVSADDNGFGFDGKAVKLTTSRKKGLSTYFVEFPFKLQEEDKNYSLSFMLSGDGESVLGVLDAVADDDSYSADNIIEELGTVPGDDWDHYSYRADVSAEGYEKGLDRKLVLIVQSKAKSLKFDDFALSVQSDSTAEFGKYEFYGGTSMATPYATGALALIRSVYPDATPLELINILKNTGRKSPDLEDKVESGRVLSLDNTDNIPPMIGSVSYNSDGNVEISGYLRDITEVFVNGEKVTPISGEDDKLIIPDNGYSLRETSFEVRNSVGNSSKTLTISDRKKFPETKKVTGYFPPECKFIPAGNRAVFFNDTTIGAVEKTSSGYKITDSEYYVEYTKLFPKAVANTFHILSAAYSNNKLYFIVANFENAKTRDDYYSGAAYPLAYEERFGYIDLTNGKTVSLCDFSDKYVEGGSLAAYNGKIYFIGGYEAYEDSFLDAVLVYDAKKKQFKDTGAALPEPRAFASYLETDGKLVGVYGAVESGEMPGIIVFDGKKWTTSAAKLECTDVSPYYISDEDYLKVYEGTAGYGENGVFCNGPFIRGVGDSFTYNAAKDKIIPFKYSMKSSDEDNGIVGVTLPGCFIACDKIEYYEDEEDFLEFSKSSDNPLSDDDDEEYDDFEEKCYLVKLNNKQGEPTVIKMKLSNKTTYVGFIEDIYGTVVNGFGKTTYKSSDTKIATVNKYGEITAKKKGKVKITVTNNKVSKTFTLTVKNPVLNATKKTLKKGAKFTLKVKKGQKGSLSFKSSAPKVASVSKKGVVTAKKKGTAVITVKTNGIKLKCKVKVVN